MHIGITYDLRSDYLAAGYDETETAEFDQLATIEAIDAALVALGNTTDRIGSARQLIERLASAGDRWDFVFNICEGLHGPGREAQVPAILDVYEIPYTFSDPATLIICLDKGLTKTVARAAGVPTPNWLVVRDLADVERCQLPFPLVAKPIAEGTGKGIDAASKVADARTLRATCDRLLARFGQPVLVEEFLPGREFTVGVLGTGRDTRVIGTLEIDLHAAPETELYSYANKEQCDELIEFRLIRSHEDGAVAAAEQIALTAWRAVGGRDAGRLDLRCDVSGRPQLIEINPLAGIHPTHSDLPMLWSELGHDYTDLIRQIIESARFRVPSHARRVSLQRVR